MALNRYLEQADNQDGKRQNGASVNTGQYQYRLGHELTILGLVILYIVSKVDHNKFRRTARS
ncbi:hypothetical protein GCM10007978_32820 [Shewanella hanedai]|nr:hypothetical protein GCM10007978_32820 [Shewanella hanedai]